MKKTILAGGLLAALSAAVILGAQFWINNMQDDVSMMETVYFGDRAAAGGVTVTTQTVQKADLLFSGAYTIKESGVDFNSKFNFGVTNHFPKKEQVDQVLNVDPYYYFAAYDKKYIAKLAKVKFMKAMISDVASHTENGNSAGEIIHVKKYTDYFPICISSGDGLPYENYFPETIFKIPVPDEALAEVKLTKDKNGDITEFHYSDSCYMNSSSLVFGNDAYLLLKDFVYSNRIEKDYDGNSEVNNVSAEIPASALGIFYLPLKNLAGYENVKVPVAEKVKRFYPIEDSVIPLGLKKSADNKNLYLFTCESEKIYLSVISRESGKCLQKLDLLPAPGASDAASEDTPEFKGMVEKEDSMMLFFDHFRFALIKINQDGSLTKEFTDILSSKAARYFSFNAERIDYDYDSNTKKLAIAAYDADPGSQEALYIYENGTLKYIGGYRPSIRQRTELGNDLYMEDALCPLKVKLP